jgi:hypothetical protein
MQNRVKAEKGSVLYETVKHFAEIFCVRQSYYVEEQILRADMSSPSQSFAVDMEEGRHKTSPDTRLVTAPISSRRI